MSETIEEVEVSENVDKKFPTLKLVKDEDKKYSMGRETFLEHSPLSKSDIEKYEKYSNQYVNEATKLLCSKVEDLESDVTGVIDIGTQDTFTITVTHVEDNEPMVLTETTMNYIDIRETLKKQEAKLLAKLND